MADFLFQYKFSIEYPHDFDYYDYAASAQHLHVELDPPLVAFNHDLVIYLRDLQHELGEILVYSENGIVTVRTISRTDSSVSTQSQSSFKTTPPPLANDFLNQLQNPPNAISPVIGRNLPPNAAQALVAFLNSGQGASVTLARDLNLTVTPNTLPGASASELKSSSNPKTTAQTGLGKNISAKHREMLQCIADSTLFENAACDPSKPPQGSQTAQAADLQL